MPSGSFITGRSLRSSAKKGWRSFSISRRTSGHFSASGAASMRSRKAPIAAASERLQIFEQGQPLVLGQPADIIVMALVGIAGPAGVEGEAVARGGGVGPVANLDRVIFARAD